MAEPPPRPVVLLAGFQFAKSTLLLGSWALFQFFPDRFPASDAFNHLMFLASHGRTLGGELVPLFGLYVAYIGYGLLKLKPGVRRTLAISSALTIVLSLQHLGVFGGERLRSASDREGLYILILFDLAVYLYLVFHPAVSEAFRPYRKA